MDFKNKKLLIKNYNLDQLTQVVNSKGFKPYRAKQLYSWIYKKLEIDPFMMKNLSQRSLGTWKV